MLEASLSVGVIAFYELPATLADQPWEAVWAAVVAGGDDCTLRGIEESKLAPATLARSVQIKIGDPLNSFHNTVEGYTDQDCNYLFVGVDGERPVWGCKI